MIKDDEIFKLIEKFSIDELNLMVVYYQDGVLETIYHELVLFLILKLQINLIQEFMVYPLQEVNTKQEQKRTELDLVEMFLVNIFWSKYFGSERTFSPIMPHKIPKASNKLRKYTKTLRVRSGGKHFAR